MSSYSTSSRTDRVFESQTSNLLDFISGRRSSQRMEKDAQAVLANLQGHRERNEPIQPLTQAYLKQAAQGSSPEQLISEAENRIRAFARNNPYAYAKTLAQATAAGLLSHAQAAALQGDSHEAMFVAMQAGLDADTLLAHDAIDMDHTSRLELWSQQRRLEAITHQRKQSSVVLKELPEPEPEKPSAFAVLVRSKQLPRRIISSLKRKRK